MSQSLAFAVVGCGARGRIYMRAARELGHRVAAIADLSPEALQAMQDVVGDEDPQVFSSGEELLSQDRLADVALISTQDAQHFQHAAMALQLGYDVVLEKPAAQNFQEVAELARLAVENDCKLILCFVLRYSPFYQTLKAVLDDNKIGDIVSIQSKEGVGPWHHAHSFVRGKWSSEVNSTPMIVAKCCHDTDVLSWITGSKAESVASHRDCSHFRPEKAPPEAPSRCTDGCPYAGTCQFDAHRYLSDQRHWLATIHPEAAQMDDSEILAWLKTSDWGRCVYHCAQDTPDHQVVSICFENGVTANHTMTAFDDGRRIRIFGTKGVLEGVMARTDHESHLECRFPDGSTEPIAIAEPEIAPRTSFWKDQWHGHGQGDFGLIAALPSLLADEAHDPTDIIEGHRIGFAADLSTKQNRVVSDF